MKEYLPGKELDALIAEKVMGWQKIDLTKMGKPHGLKWMWDRKEGCYFWETQECPEYSTHILEAWKVVDKLRHDGWTFGLLEGKYAKGPWRADFMKDTEEVNGFGKSIPYAICLAALKAIEK